MYPRVFEIVHDGLRPVFRIAIYRGQTALDGTSIQSARFFMQRRDDESMKIDGAYMTPVSVGPPAIFSYTWQPGDTGAVGAHNSWVMIYWGVGDTLPEYIAGPEITVFERGTRLNW